MWELNHKNGWALNNWCFWTMVLEKILESPLDCKEIKPVNPKGNQPWIFIGRTDAKAEAPILWPPDAKSRLIGKDPDAGKDWRQKEKGTAEDEMVAAAAKPLWWCPTLYNPMHCIIPDFPVLHFLLEFAQTIFIELKMPFNYLILCCPLLLLPSIFPSIRVFPNELVLWFRWPKVLELQLQHQFFQWIFRTDFL